MIAIRKLKYAAVCVAAQLLSGCVSGPATLLGNASPPSSLSSSSSLQPALGPLVYSGRFSMNYLKNGALQREQGGFEWTITPRPASRDSSLPTAMRLSLLGPLGNTLAVIAFEPQANLHRRASIATTAQTDYAPDLDSLMQRALGWRLPLVALLPWLGKTQPADAPSDWQITVPIRHDNGLPRQVNASNPALSLNVRLVFEP